VRLFRRRDEERALPAQTTWPSSQIVAYAPHLAPQRALQVADVFACVRVLADSAASLPLIPYRRREEGRVRVDGGRLPALIVSPAPAVTQANLIATCMAHLVLYGNAYLGKFRDRAGRIDQLAMLHPDRVAVELRAGRPRYTVTGPTGEQAVASVDDLIHIRALSTDGLLGLSPIKQCRMAVSLADGLGVFAEAFTRNGARPSGFLKIPGGTNRDTLAMLSDEAAAKHGGAENAHRIAIITGDLEWTPMAGPLDDLQFVEQRKLSTAEICRIFRVPPWMVGASSGDSMTYSNTEQQALSFVMHSLRPWLVLIEQAISQDADLCPGNLYVEFLLDALLRADSKTRAEIYDKALDPITGWLNRDEVRRLENLEPEPLPRSPQPQLMEDLVA
jgi:HK97 family phage portal protein